MKKNVLIIGGGLSGLTLAYLLSKEKINYQILEASDRLGGRIQTVKGKLKTPLELGATWFSDVHAQFMSLLQELGLQKFPQFSEGISLFQTKSFEPPQGFYVPKNQTPSYRLKGGTQSIIEALASHLNKKCIHLEKKAVSISKVDNKLLVKTSDEDHFLSDQVAICIPPHLIENQIIFNPDLPYDLKKLLPKVQTWMAGSIKFILEYDAPFWKEKGFSGMLYSHCGPIVEMYDHTNYEKNKFGFTGFLSGGASNYSFEKRKELVISQLGEMFGEIAISPILYSDKIWIDEFISNGYQSVDSPHQNNGHALLKEAYFNGNLFLSATETSDNHPGYMEGAIDSAFRTFKNLIS